MTKSSNITEFETAVALVKARHDPKGSSTNKKEYAFNLTPFSELRPGTQSAYLVEGVIPAAGLVAVWGPPKCGKSFWSFDLSMHIALGWKYRGRRVTSGPVVYLAFEGGAGFGARAEAFRRTHEGLPDKIPFFLLVSNAKLVRDHKALIEAIDDQIGDWPPVAVVLDTLNRSIDGSESKDEDMGAYLTAAEAIVYEFDCAVIIVHHCGVDGSRPRGHTSLTGAADAQLSVKRDAAANVVVSVEYAKDGPEGATFTSTLKVVEVGTDDAGNKITSCAVEPVEGAAGAAQLGPKKLTGAAKVALDLLYRAIADDGKPAPASNHIPASANTVAVETWRAYCDKGTVSDSTDPDNRRRAFVRILKGLQARGIIGVWSDLVWLA